jgi:transposase
MSKRIRYPIEYREKILDLYRAGRSASSLARDFEPTVWTIRTWILQAETQGRGRPIKSGGSEREELERLRKENRILREEREILKKAAAWFAKETDSRGFKSSK